MTRIVFFQKWANPSLYFVYFRSFQTINTIFTTNQCDKCPSRIWRWDSNPRPFEHEFSPITTRPGLPTVLEQSLYATMVYVIKYLPTAQVPHYNHDCFLSSRELFSRKRWTTRSVKLGQNVAMSMCNIKMFYNLLTHQLTTWINICTYLLIVNGST